MAVSMNDEREFLEMMNNNWVAFTYVKVNGDIRYAVGTISDELLESVGKNHIIPERNENNLRYFDLTKGMPRTMKLDNLMQFLSIGTYNEALEYSIDIMENADDKNEMLIEQYKQVIKED